MHRFLLMLAFLTAPLIAQNGRVDELADRIERDYVYLDQLYKYLHANPELSFYEEQTAARLTEELESLGFAVTSDVGGHGFVGVLRNGEGPTVMIRTDLDALPVVEETGLEYASTVKLQDESGNVVGVMHACGHDVHMTVFTGTARMLASLKETWQGTLVMIGQPAEERGAGAVAMLNDGLYERFPRPDYAIALHVNATMPAGTIGYCKGFALANVDMVDVTIYGVGGHGAYPHNAIDPVVLAAETIVNLQTVVSREIKPIEPAVVTVGSIHGGTKHNIIGDKVVLQLTLRSYSDAVRNQTIEAIRRITKGMALAAGVPDDLMPTVHVREEEFTPATYNDPALTARLVDVLKGTLGEENLIETEPVMGGEDFGRYGRVEPRVPICMFWLGTISKETIRNSDEMGQSLPSLHSSKYAPLPKPTITTGVLAMTVAALELLHSP